MNQFRLRASIAERGKIRYTPAGLPALDLELQHESVVQHEGQDRKVALNIKALAIGSLVPMLDQTSLSAICDFEGFLAVARNGRGILFHVTALSSVS